MLLDQRSGESQVDGKCRGKTRRVVQPVVVFKRRERKWKHDGSASKLRGIGSRAVAAGRVGRRIVGRLASLGSGGPSAFAPCAAGDRRVADAGVDRIAV